MIYLIEEETASFTIGFGIDINKKIKGYYKCDSEDEVREYCNNKTKELKGTYNDDRMDKNYIYTELPAL